MHLMGALDLGLPTSAAPHALLE